MKILISLHNPIPLIIHETLSLAFALSSFGHEIQLRLGDEVANQLLAEPENSLTKMLSSLELYDILPAWVSADMYQKFVPTLPENLASQIMVKPNDFKPFDSNLSF